MSLTGCVGGILIFFMMRLIARALQLGPFGLTFAFQNSGCVLPILLLVFLFGRSYGFSLTTYALIGLSCVIIGMFFLSRSNELTSNVSIKKWLGMALIIFFIQGFVLFLFQWRCLLFVYPANSHPLIPWNCGVEQDIWFMGGLYLMPALLQAFQFGWSERRWFSRREAALGISGGVLNGGSTFCLINATKFASGTESTILFPLFSVGVIVLCSVWGWKINHEKINWIGLLLCIAGVIVGAF